MYVHYSKYSTYDRTWASQLGLNWAGPGAGSRGRGWGVFLDRVRVRVIVIGLSSQNITSQGATSHGGSVRATDTWPLPWPARIKNPGDNRRERCLVLMPPGRSSSAHSRQQSCCAPTGHRTAASARCDGEKPAHNVDFKIQLEINGIIVYHIEM